jgi:ankyrin repeat protein
MSTIFKKRDPQVVKFEAFLHSVSLFMYPKLSGRSPQTNGANSEQQEANKASPLHIAAFSRHEDSTSKSAWPLLLEQAVKEHFDFNSTDKSGRTILHLLAQNDSAETIADFLKIAKDVDLEVQDENGVTPLQAALLRRNFEAAEELVRQGASLDNKAGLPYSPQEYLQNALIYSQSLAKTASNDHDKERWLSNVNMWQEKLMGLQQALSGGQLKA